VRRGFLAHLGPATRLECKPAQSWGPILLGGAVQREHATVYGSRERVRVNGHTSERFVHDGSLNLNMDEGGDTRREPEHARAGTERNWNISVE